MRFPDDEDYLWAGRFKRLWYKIITPHTHGARLWMVTTSILCALAVTHSVNGSWGYHGSAKDTGFLSGDYVNGVRLAWQIDTNDADLDMINTYIARDGYLFLVGYKGSQRVAIGYDASYSSPRELWRVDVDDEPGVHWWDGGPPRRQYTDLSGRWDDDHGLAFLGNEAGSKRVHATEFPGLVKRPHRSDPPVLP